MLYNKKLKVSIFLAFYAYVSFHACPSVAVLGTAGPGAKNIYGAPVHYNVHLFSYSFTKDI